MTIVALFAKRSTSLHHVVRPEDWPVLPLGWHTFEFRPFDFFSAQLASRPSQLTAISAKAVTDRWGKRRPMRCRWVDLKVLWSHCSALILYVDAQVEKPSPRNELVDRACDRLGSTDRRAEPF